MQPRSRGAKGVDQLEHNQRVERVETDVLNLRSDFASVTRDIDAVKSDIKALGGILVRIESGVQRAQEKSEERSERNKPNLTAIVSVLITIISILVGGSWLISGSMATFDERTTERSREFDQLHVQIARVEQHQWDLRTSSPAKTP